MIVYTTYECKKCGHEIEVEVEIGEDDGNLDEFCPECNQPTPSPPHGAGSAQPFLIRPTP